MIDLLIPSRGRESKLLNTLISAKKTSDNPDNIHVIIYLDDDDQYNYNIDTLRIFKRTTIIINKQDILSKCWNKCFENGDGKIVMHCADDIIFQSKKWDSVVEYFFKNNHIALLYGKDGHQDKNCPTHSFTLRMAAEIIGNYLPPYFTADWNDIWLQEVYTEINRLYYDPLIVIQHQHVNVDIKYNDDTYKLGSERRQEASLVFEKKRHEIFEWAEKLKKHL